MDVDIELINLIKIQVVNEIKKDYFLVKKTNVFDNSDRAKNSTFIMFATEVVCDYFKVSMDSVLSGIRVGNNPRVRHIVSLLCREVCKHSIPYSQIGEFFGKDHATIIHGYKEALKISDVDKRYKEDIDKLKEIVRSSFYKESHNVKK